jgi:hypothetical protein
VCVLCLSHARSWFRISSFVAVSGAVAHRRAQPLPQQMLTSSSTSESPLPLLCPAAAASSDCILDALRTILRREGEEGVRKLSSSTASNSSALQTGLRFAARYGNSSELWLEFGAWKGKSTRRIAVHHAVDSFDSFLGLPEDWRPSHRGGAADQKAFAAKFLGRGAFSKQGQPPFNSTERLRWHVGWFNETLPPFLGRRPSQNVSFVHIDSDLYSSARTVLGLLAQRLSPGAVLVFDEVGDPACRFLRTRVLPLCAASSPRARQLSARLSRRAPLPPTANQLPRVSRRRV